MYRPLFLISMFTRFIYLSLTHVNIKLYSTTTISTSSSMLISIALFPWEINIENIACVHRAGPLGQWVKLPAFNIVGSLRDREVAWSASGRQVSNFVSCVWRAGSSYSSHHPQDVLLVLFSLHVHKGGLKPHLFHFMSLPMSLTFFEVYLGLIILKILKSRLS